MKKNISIISSLVLTTLLAIAGLSTVHAESTPAFNMEYLGNDAIEPATYPGGSVVLKYKISNSDEKNAIIMKLTGNAMGAENFIPDSWFTTPSQDTTIIDPKTETELSITIKVPADTKFGKYTGAIKAIMLDYGLPNKVRDSKAAADGAGVKIGTAIGDEIVLSIKDKSEIDILDSALLTDGGEQADTENSSQKGEGLLSKYWVQMGILVLILAILGKIFFSPSDNKKK